MQIKVMGTMPELFQLQNMLLSNRANAVFKASKPANFSDDEAQGVNNMDIAVVELDQQGGHDSIFRLFETSGFYISEANTAMYTESPLAIQPGETFAVPEYATRISGYPGAQPHPPAYKM